MAQCLTRRLRQLLCFGCFSALLVAGRIAPAQGTNSLRPWADYRTIMWIGDSARNRPEQMPLFLRRLREMGINTGMIYGSASPQPLVQANFSYYVENLVNRGLCLKFNSKVTDWDKFVTDWAKDGRSETALVRDFSLEDPQWLGWARNEVRMIARQNREHQPLAYNLRDELSTTISANPFDYDFSPVALAGFRAWLKTQYPSLEALNAEWQTGFRSWEDARPFTTDQIKARMASGEALPHGRPDWAQLQQLRFEPTPERKDLTRWNFAPWADFRTYMDSALANALNELRSAAHEVDPVTPVGIEGTQMPHAFGGYDLWRLSQVLDWVEPYDIGSAREIFGSFMPGRPILTTVFETDTRHAQRRLWHLLLQGDRGCLVWWSEDCLEWRTNDYVLTPKAQALTPALQEMTSPLARIFLRAQRKSDPILIHYSQASIQSDWLLESTVDGSSWLRRFSSFESEHNRLTKVRNGWVKAFQDLGFTPTFISSAQIERGDLQKWTNAVLVLPSSRALSGPEATAIKNALSSSRPNVSSVFFDDVPGAFDEHARLRSDGPPAPFSLTSGQPGGIHCLNFNGVLHRSDSGDIAAYGAQRLREAGASALSDWVAAELGLNRPPIQIATGGRVRIHRFDTRHGQLVAFERNVEYQMSEDLKQAGGNEWLEKPVEIEAALKSPSHIYDLRSGQYLGFAQKIRFTLDPWRPSLFALTTEKRSAESIVPDLTE